MADKTAHVAEYKKEVVKRIVELCKKYSIVGAVNMENLPAPQLQKLREKLRGKVELLMAKRRIIKRAIEGVKKERKGIEELESQLKGMPALLFTNENPFSLYKIIKQNKSKAPAKAGQSAPGEIIVRAGPTGFLPGPIIGELGALKIKAGVEAGKVAIKEDCVVASEGDNISQQLAQVLTRLGIEPMEIGLEITAVYEDGTIYKKGVLDIDEKKFMAELQKAASHGINLAVEAGYPAKEAIVIMIGKAFRAAKHIGVEYKILEPGIIEELIANGERQALSIRAAGNIETGAAKKAEERATEAKEAAGQEEGTERGEEKAKEEEKQKEEESAKREEAERKEEPVSEKKEEPRGEERVKKMVEETRRFAKGGVTTAEQVIKEAEGKDEYDEVIEDIKKDKARKEQEKVEKLTKELVSKGTLRKE